MPSDDPGSISGEIGANLGCTTNNVEYKLRNIWATWLLSERPTAESPP